MNAKHRVDLGDAQQTLLIPLYGRAVETRKANGLLADPKAVEMVEAIDYDFSRFGGAARLFGSVIRTAIFDHWARAFLARHPAGTVIEIGTGLDTRFERVDNGTVSWIDLDLPDAIALRRNFFTDTGRRRMLARSVLDEAWVDMAREFPGPYFPVAEASLIYLPEADAHHAIGLIAQHFPGPQLAFDTWGRWIVRNQHKHDVLSKMDARLTWACDRPRALERLGPGLRLRETRTFAHIPREVRTRLPLAYRASFPLVGRVSPQARHGTHIGYGSYMATSRVTVTAPPGSSKSVSVSSQAFF